jgi:hypothetical protein
MPFTVVGGKYALQTLTAVGTNTITVNAAVPFVVADFTSIQRIAALFTPAGSTVVTNGDFATDTNWTKGGGVTISGGAANATSASTIVSQNIAFTVGQQYLVSIQYTRTSGTSLRFSNSMTDGTNTLETVATVNTATLTTITFAFRAVASGFTIGAAGSTFTGTIDNVSILVGAALKGIAYARRATSTTVVELESEFFDPVDGTTKTQAIGDNILISKNWAESATTGWSVSGVTSSITDRATIGISGDEASACIYDESKIMTSALTSTTLPPIIGAGGVWVTGHLQNWATQEMYGACDWNHTNTGTSLGGLHPQSLGFHYVVFGGKRVSVTGQITWEPCRDANTISRAKTLFWMKVDAQAGILGPGDGSSPWFPGTESRMCFFNCSSEVLTGFNVCWRPGNAVIQGGSAKITASGALSVFGSGYNGFAIGAPSGQRFVVSDARSGAFWDQFYGTPATANFTNLLTPITTVTRATAGVVTFNFNFKSAYQNLGIGSLIQILKSDGTTTETSITTTTVNTDLTVLARTLSGANTGNPPTTYNNASWTYAIWKYGSIPLSGSFAQSSYSLGTAGNALDVVHGGFFNQLADSSITESNSATVAAYTVINSLNELYDYSIYWKTINTTNMKWQGIGNRNFVPTGLSLVFANEVVISSAAGSVYSPNTGTNVVTIKSPTLTPTSKFTSLSADTITVTTQATVAGTYALLSAATIALPGGVNYQSLSATTQITGLPTTGVISAAGSLGFGSSTIAATGDLSISNTALSGTLTINTATARTLTLTSVTGSVTVNVTGGGTLTVVLAGTTAAGAVTVGAGVTKAVQCSLAINGGNTFNLVKRYGTTGSYTDLGYTAGITSDSFLVPLGEPVEVAMWTLGYLTFTRTIPTTNGGFSLLADMIPEPDVDIALDVSAYLANISVTYASGTFTATFNANMQVPGIEPTKAIQHRLLGLEGSMRALLPPGMSTTVDVEPDEIQINKPAVFLVLGAGATDVSIAGFFNTAPAKVIDPAYIINPRRAGDNLRVEIPLVKPALDVAAMAAAVRAELTAELTQVTKVAKLHGVGAALVVTPTTRVAGSVSQTITTVDTTTTVQEV